MGQVFSRWIHFHRPANSIWSAVVNKCRVFQLCYEFVICVIRVHAFIVLAKSPLWMMWLRYVSLNNRLFLVQAVLIIHTNSGRRGQGFHCRLSVCFSAWYLKNRCSYDRLTWHAVVPRWVLETHLFWDLAVKVMSHKISASVGLCTFVSVGFF